MKGVSILSFTINLLQVFRIYLINVFVKIDAGFYYMLVASFITYILKLPFFFPRVPIEKLVYLFITLVRCISLVKNVLFIGSSR